MHTAIRHGLLASLLVAITLLLPACGSSKPKPEESGPASKDMLADLKDLLEGAAKGRQKPPARPTDLGRFEGPYPAATAGISSGVIVYQWGQGLSTGSEGANTIVGYDSKAPKEGGWVLMQDGSLKKLSVEEFRTAPKAGKR